MAFSSMQALPEDTLLKKQQLTLTGEPTGQTLMITQAHISHGSQKRQKCPVRSVSAWRFALLKDAHGQTEDKLEKLSSVITMIMSSK